jgi:hypothetical protein
MLEQNALTIQTLQVSAAIRHFLELWHSSLQLFRATSETACPE